MVERIYPAALRHAARVLPNDPAIEPADLVQAAYLKAGRHLDETRSEGEQATYLCRTISTLAIDYWRVHERRQAERLHGGLRAGGSVEHTAIVRAELAAVLDADRPGVREAALLWAGFSCEEIAAQTGMTPSGVKSRAYRAHHHRL